MQRSFGDKEYEPQTQNPAGRVLDFMEQIIP